ncbi:MAG: enoyl-CoA hydratase [Polyangiaceae bacterium]|nr:enoyl-CoA hydratase [Polyangiaceae bacterium]
MSEQVLLDERDGHVAVLSLNRPRAKNALSFPLLNALAEALTRAAQAADVRAIVLTGSGGSFCSGADLKSAMTEVQGNFGAMDTAIDKYHAIIRAIVGAPKPVIAAVDGAAVGFGCDLALACDLRIVSNEAYFQEKFVKIGLMPDGGGTFWLPRLVGIARAMEMMLTGEAVPAARALEMGLVNRVVPAASLRDEALSMARALAKGPPLAFAEIKASVRASFAGTIDQTLDREKAGQLKCLVSGDCMEGVMAWMEKREPNFTGK